MQLMQPKLSTMPAVAAQAAVVDGAGAAAAGGGCCGDAGGRDAGLRPSDGAT